MLDVAKYVEWIKLSPRYLLPIVLFTGFILFVPSDALEVFGLATLRKEFAWLFGIFCLASSALLISSGLVFVCEWLYGLWESRSAEKELAQIIRNLSDQEKDVLRQYIEENITTLYFSFNNGVVGGLVAKNILFRSADVGYGKFPYNVQPWAWEMLKEYPELLDSND